MIKVTPRFFDEKEDIYLFNLTFENLSHFVEFILLYVGHLVWIFGQLILYVRSNTIQLAMIEWLDFATFLTLFCFFSPNPKSGGWGS